MSHCCGCSSTSSSSRITHHFREWEAFPIPCSSLSSLIINNKAQQQQQPLQFHGLKSSTTPKKTTRRTKFPRFSFSYSYSYSHKNNNNASFGTVSCFQSRLPRPLSDSSSSQKEDDRELSSEGLSSVAGGIVALGKFDALHVGLRQLAIQASKAGPPFLLSFVGMAEVLGWAPRLPIVAPCDRVRVLSSWAPFCGNVTPREVLIDFAGVRQLNPRMFVEKLSNELGVCGVVAGENYRFGYKAAGDAAELVRLCDEYGMQAYIINSVMDKNQDSSNSSTIDKKERGQVSSTRVSYALSKGDINYVSELLGRDHRLIMSVKNREELLGAKNRVSAPKSCLLNLPPREGLYENCSLVLAENNRLPCRVLIDSTHIHVESDVEDCCMLDASGDLQTLGIEFRGQGS